jgi:hypothetical protein
LSNTILHGQAAAFERAWTSACALGIHRPKAVVTPLVWDTDGFAAVRPSTVQASMTAPMTMLANYQDDKTRISAAGGGVTGSPPTWDPV